MANGKWIKIVTDGFEDEKVLLIETLPEADSIIVIWFKLLCLAGKQNNSGVFMINDKMPYTEKMLATIFRRKESTVQLALQTFEQFGMIEIVDGVITIPNWGKHQNFDKIEKNNEYMREYMKKYRAKQKLLVQGNEEIVEEVKKDVNLNVNLNSKTNSKVNVSGLDKNRIDKNRIDNKKEIYKEKKFTPPTIEQVQEYCTERNNNINAEQFIDYYASIGWKVGKNPMKDWKACVRTWERNNKGGKANAVNSRTNEDLSGFGWSE